MDTIIGRRIYRFKRYMRRTYKNKLCAIVLLMAGMVPVWLDRDGTALLLMLVIAIPLFFSKKNYMIF